MRFPMLAAAAAMGACLAGAAHADPPEGIANPQYPDGTGDDQVDRLNAGQLGLPPPYDGPTSYPAAPYPYAPPPPMPPGLYGAPRPGLYGAPPPPSFSPPSFSPND